MSVNKGNLEDFLSANKLAFEEYSHGYAAFGRASEIFDKAVKAAGATWSLQQGAIQIVKKGEPAQTKAYLLSPSTGLLGSPTHTPPDKGTKAIATKAKCLLNPQLRPGLIVRIESREIKGEFVIQKLDHEGDTHSPSWFTSIEAFARK